MEGLAGGEKSLTAQNKIPVGCGGLRAAGGPHPGGPHRDKQQAVASAGLLGAGPAVRSQGHENPVGQRAPRWAPYFFILI